MMTVDSIYFSSLQVSLALVLFQISLAPFSSFLTFRCAWAVPVRSAVLCGGGGGTERGCGGVRWVLDNDLEESGLELFFV
eukprot:1323577-Rhodomonas_salina.1